MKKEPLCEEFSYEYNQDYSKFHMTYAQRERAALLQKVKDTLSGINYYKNSSKGLRDKNKMLYEEIQIFKELISKEKTKLSDPMASQKQLNEIKNATSVVENKLVQLKIEYGTKAEEIEEMKDDISKVYVKVQEKDLEIMKLHQEMEKLNGLVDDSKEIFKPSRQSIGSPRNPILLFRRRN
ncbi:hypothetical protein SteCoe_5637 [Stentor coeruleus]|uniref:Uncharacterized protein n=1 Tax=Stentor coeruleus TaxID=5963 RepID=A0A1R2CRY3_9CILI|nr:hypothetical protein SteCoe_5637 [Stentor coeruleus]